MPLEQIGQPVIFYAFYTDSGSGKTGLTVTADVWEVIADGTATEIASAQACTEIGDGLYRYRVVGASIDAQAEYICVFKCTVGTCDQAHIPALWVIGKGWVERVDAAITTRTKPADTQARVTLVDTTTTNTDMRGTDNAATAVALAVAQADLDNPDQYKADLTGISTLTAAQVWNYAVRTLTQSAAQIAEIVEGSVVSVYQYTTWSFSLTGLGDISARDRLYFTAKGNLDDGDDESATILQVEETDGLLYIGGAAPTLATLGTLVVNDGTLGNITVTVDDSVTGLGNQRGLYDVKMVTATGTTSVLTISTFKIQSVITKAIA